MEVQQEQQVQDNQLSQVEGGEEGGAQVAPPQAAATPPPEAKPGLLDKIREKGNVAPPAVKPSEQAALEAAAKPAFKANLKFKSWHKEHDVPEIFHGLMTDEKKEKFVHDLLNRAHGADIIRERMQEVKQSRDQAHQAYMQVMEPIRMGQEAYKRGDMDMVFETLRIDPNKVLQWAYDKVQLSQMPPEQQRLHQERAQAQRLNWENERKISFMTQQSMEQQADQIDQMIGMVLERPDYSSLAQEFDTRKGKQGAFRDVVALMGDQEYQRTGKLISPLEAAKMAVDFLGLKTGQQAVPQGQPAPQPQAQPAPAPAAQTKVTLPNVGGQKASAPAKAKVKSIDDLRKIHQQMAAK